MKWCSQCGAILPWPEIEMSPTERKIFKVLNTDEGVPSHKHLARLVGCTVVSSEVIVHRLRYKLQGKALIESRPLRIIRLNQFGVVE